MKPPSRARSKRDWSLGATLPESQRKAGCKWGRADLKKLLHGLKTVNQATAGLEEIDCGLLKRHIPTQSISEINVMVDSLKRKAISSTRFQMHMKNWEEKQARKSIEEWAHMTSALAGTLETVVSAAFFQMLIVSSTEPCTLWNCDPHQDPGPTIGCTFPLKPVRHVMVKGEDPARVPPAMLLITSTPTMSGSRRFSAPSKVVKVQTSQALTPQKKTSPTAANPIPPAECSDTNVLSVSPTDQTAQLLSNKVPASLSSCSHKPPTSSASDLSPVPTAAQSVSSYGLPVSSFSSSHSTVPLSETAEVIHARFGQMSKHPTIQSPKKFGVKCVVDFEKIYKFLSVIQKPSEDCRLTPMAVCEKTLENTDFAEYYTFYDDGDGRIICINRCDKRHNDNKICKNGGNCTLYRDLGEVCKCHNVDSIWYLGSDCDMPIHKTPFYAGLSVTLAAMLILVGALAAYAVINKRKQKKKKDIKQKLVNEWLDDDYQWTRSTSPVTHGAKKESVMYGIQQSQPFTYGSHRSSPSVGMCAQPQNIEFSKRAYTKPASSPLQTLEFQTNPPMRIIRPQTRSSWDV